MITINKNTSKRGRKPKEINFDSTIVKEESLSCLEEKIILHLPITLERILELNSLSMNKKQSSLFENISKKKTIEPTTLKQTYLYNGIKGKQVETTVYDSISLFPIEISNDNFASIKLMTTDISCWWCSHQFDTYPICMPEKYNGKKNIFEVSGCFCSFNCTLSYKIEKNTRGDQSLVSYMHRKLTGSFKTIKKAPSPYCLKKFGGPISIEEYRESFETGRDIHIYVAPMVFIPRQIEDSRTCEMLRDNIIKFNADISKCDSKKISPNKIKDASKRQKITKSIKIENNSNTLDKIMGFK